jgi:hypothetical protein
MGQARAAVARTVAAAAAQNAQLADAWRACVGRARTTVVCPVAATAAHNAELADAEACEAPAGGHRGARRERAALCNKLH